MAIEDTLISIDTTLKALLVIAQSGTAGVAAVSGTPADETKVKKATYFHLVEKKQVVKVDAGGERPLGGVEITAAEAKKLDDKYKADVAKNSTPTGAAGEQKKADSAGSSSDTGGPSFQDVTAKITELSKLPEVGRAKVVELLKKWGVDKFPAMATKGVPFADLIKDIEAAMAPPKAEEESSEFADLGL